MSVGATGQARIQHHRASASSTSDSAPERDSGDAKTESKTEASLQAREGASDVQPSGDSSEGGTNDLVYRSSDEPETEDIRFQGGR